MNIIDAAINITKGLATIKDEMYPNFIAKLLYYPHKSSAKYKTANITICFGKKHPATEIFLLNQPELNLGEFISIENNLFIITEKSKKFICNASLQALTLKKR